jgi:hypothetical protein
MSDIDVRKVADVRRISEAMDLVQADDLPIEDRAALYAFLYEVQRRINRSLGIRQKGRTAQHELIEHMTRSGVDGLGPLYLAWEAFDVKYPCNAADQWTDENIQSAMRAIREDPTTRDFIREVPHHLEIDVLALGQAVHDGSARARALYDELRARKWRTEGGRRPALRVRESKKKKAAA